MFVRLPIRLRLTFAFAIVMALLLGATGSFLYFRLDATLDQAIDAGLRSRAQDVAALVQQSESGLSESTIGLVERGKSFAQILDARGQVLDATPPLGRQPLLNLPQQARARQRATFFADVRLGKIEGPARLLAIPVFAQDSHLLVVVGTSLEPRKEALGGLLTQLLIGGPLALLVASLAGYGLAAAALRPVEVMRGRAARISGGEPTVRLPVSAADDEVRRLGETLNAMLDRIEETMRRERRFVADASHELRTPLGLLRGEIEVALRGHRTVTELKMALHSAGEEADRLSQLAEDLLVLARSDEGGLPVRFESFRVETLFDTVATRFADRARGLARSVVVEPAGEVIDGDRLRLEQALGNLVDNALRHGAGVVRLRAEPSPGGVELHVLDQGQGLPTEFLPNAFHRFSRGDEARGRGGTGLGLSIVEVIAQAHGGSAHALNRDAGGADVWIELPEQRAAGERRQDG